MKYYVKLFVMLVALTLLLSACSLQKLPNVQEESAPDVSTGIPDAPDLKGEVPEPDSEPETQPNPETDPSVDARSLTERLKPIGALGNTWSISVDAISHMYDPEMRLYGNALLFSENVADEFTSGMELKLISLEDGSVLAETFLEGSGMMRLQTGDGSICVHDSATGKIVFLNDSFAVESEINLEQDCEEWFIDRSFETLYIFAYEGGVRAISLLDDRSMQLVKGTDVQILGSTDQYVVFSYRTEDRGIQYEMCLDLEGGALSTVPHLIDAGTVSRSRQSWFIRDGEAWGKYHLLREDGAWTITYPDGLLSLVPLREKLIAITDEATGLALYETDGTFLTKCSFPGESNFYPDYEPVWSGYLQMWILTANRNDRTELIFWDPNVPTEGTDLTPEPMTEDIVPGGNAAAAELYDRAAQLSERYGVDIRIADQCLLDYSHYTSYEVTDTGFITLALDEIEKCFSLYPEGFFRQLSTGGVNEISIELVGGIAPKPGMNTTESASAFVANIGDRCVMVADCYLVSDYVLHHELSHMIDRKLAYDASLRVDAQFSEEAWMSLQPEGFVFSGTYTEDYDDVSEFFDPSYFASNYGATYPTEDRATLFGSLMAGWIIPDAFPEPMHAKLMYYAACIRDCFDTEGWPAQTVWEQLITG